MVVHALVPAGQGEGEEGCIGEGGGRGVLGAPTAKPGCGPACSADQRPQLQHRSVPAPHCKESSCSARPHVHTHSSIVSRMSFLKTKKIIPVMCCMSV